jgi:hypothetical protein
MSSYYTKNRCIHDNSYYCRICRPHLFCTHDKRRNTCKECGGSQICRHNIQRSSCKQCNVKQLCEHDIRMDTCRRCNPLSWAKRKLSRARRDAKRFNYIKPKITPQELVVLMSESMICCGCEEPLDWDGQSPCLHHDHESGAVFGFAHRFCNVFEGQSQELGIKRLVSILKNFFPKVVEELKAKV